jgi:hypothetical protein
MMTGSDLSLLCGTARGINLQSDDEEIQHAVTGPDGSATIKVDGSITSQPTKQPIKGTSRREGFSSKLCREIKRIL